MHSWMWYFLIFDVFIPFNDMMEDIRERPTIFLTYLTYRRHIYKSNYVKIKKKNDARENALCILIDATVI